MTLQVEHDELEAKFLEERTALEAKYQLLYQPLYAKVSWGFFSMIVQLFTFKVIESDLYANIRCNVFIIKLVYKWMQRYEIVNGLAEVEGVAMETAADTDEGILTRNRHFVLLLLWFSTLTVFLWSMCREGSALFLANCTEK